MALALNKTTLKQQRDQAKTYRQYLPSLDLKRQQLQAALKTAVAEQEAIESSIARYNERIEPLYPLLGSTTIATRKITSLVRVGEVVVEEENVVGTRLPVVRKLECEVADYSKWVTPFWVDTLVDALQHMAGLRVRHQVSEQRVSRLEHAVRRITQRVNLFEKVLIPQAEDNIRRIVIFLSDQERAAVVRSKIAKGKQQSTDQPEDDSLAVS
ncbi:V-type ATP synthase subunit D [Roseiconus nitratireducens]|uniref:V-type ATP synthase subunit D n=1 Tax=Roseiconus nitratireducens TaxID=2605748 RepID=A0A5M6D095_9BACT|nr:V-type ATP synthase subunit D [Roseiconus nitratireducens]KAA5539712.1 V-type ATP synthase subunit D [Roseiconus nitratireducens]